MIIKSRVASSPYFRRTHIEKPGEKTFSSLLQNLLVQWDILQAGSEQSKAFEYSHLVNVVEGSDRLIVDKQSEWNLLCRDIATEERDIVVEIEIVLKSDLFVSSSNSQSTVRSSPNIVKEAKEDVQRPHSSSERITASKPSFAFHSVEPQAPKTNPRTFSSKSSATAPDAKSTQQPFQLLSMDEIMARSRAQGESLNQLFGTMQARSAGRPHESEQESRVQNQAGSTNDLVSPLPVFEHSDSGLGEGREEEPNNSQPSRSRVRSEEEIAEQNRQTETLWQERLAQMGHGPNSQSAYNRMRLGKTEARGDMPSELTATSTFTSHNPALPATPSLGAGRSPLVALDEVNEESTSRQPSQTFPTFTPEQTPDPEQGSSPFFEGRRWRGSRPNSSSGRSTPGPDESNSRPSSLRARLFRRHRHLSDVAASSRFIQGRVDNTSGTSTPRSFNSIVFRRQRRPINARSLSDALLGTGRIRSGAESGTDGEQTDPPIRSQSNRTISQVGKILPKVIRTGRRKSSRNSLHQEADNAGERPGEETGEDGRSSKAQEKILRPSLMRASHSSPISATAVNLSGADGITLHVASVTASPFNVERDASGTARPDPTPHVPKIGKNLFEIMLPRELRIACLRSLVTLHEAEAAKIRDGSSLELKRNASMQATRELVRLSRVSRQWQTLVYDGQLWQDLDVTMMRDISNECLLRITRMAGPFVKRLNMSNMHGLSSEMLRAMNSCCVTQDRSSSISNKPKVVRARSAARLSNTMTNTPLMNNTFTSLTELNLSGCRSLQTGALHHALVRLPQLQNLDMTGVPAVENATLVILGASLPHLRTLNVSRCINLTGDGLNTFIDAAQGSLYDRTLFTKRRQYPEIDNIDLAMTELRAAGLKETDKELMCAIGRSMPHLRVLDLSYASDLSDDAVAAFVRHPGPDRLESKHRPGLSSQTMPEKHESRSGPFVSLTARQSGGNTSFEDVTYRRHFQDLRHINLSSCRHLTDRSCAHLAFAVPNLKCLELSNVGNAIRDDGIVKLLETTRYIERVDVEGASDLGIAFIQALTPPVRYVESLGLPVVSDSTIVTGRISRRSARRARTGVAADANSALEHREERTQWTTDVPTGAYLTHLIASHLSRLDANCLLTLVRRCPRLYHLEVDDTRANDALLTEFVTLARQRRKYGAYVSLVDCRAVTKATNSDVFAAGSARPRAGKIGDEYLPFAYEGAASYHSALNSDKKKSAGKSSEIIRQDGLNASLRSSLPFAASPNSTSGQPNECDESLVTVKTFWAWQAVDVRLRFKKKAEAKRLAALGRGRSAADGEVGGRRARVDPLAAALSYISGGGGVGGGAYDSDDEEGNGRWGRIASNLLGNGEEGDDARGCSIM